MSTASSPPPLFLSRARSAKLKIRKRRNKKRRVRVALWPSFARGPSDSAWQRAEGRASEELSTQCVFRRGRARGRHPSAFYKVERGGERERDTSRSPSLHALFRMYIICVYIGFFFRCRFCPAVMLPSYFYFSLNTNGVGRFSVLGWTRVFALARILKYLGECGV